MNDERFMGGVARNLMNTARWSFFREMNNHLGMLCRPIYVVETGTSRSQNNFSGDGQSTLVWDWMAGEYGGHVVSIDIDRPAIDVARQSCSTRVQFIHEDSVVALREIPNADKIDVLYLDSMDAYLPGSAEHHYQELIAIYDELRPGAIIAIDDYQAENKGKHVVVAALFARKNVKPTIWTSAIISWVKPAEYPTIASLTDPV